ncbi:hypothetical protein CEXT_711901 [Caerostris extrusa]|uniref:Uncharacterized protein n=1 Tax=Caerostris extrusa TaxID=172846 RepID=A0AAV4MM88_CAEEX|nr:hypothetical protein CEXT_711901 [Caerostris extrusa]
MFSPFDTLLRYLENSPSAVLLKTTCSWRHYLGFKSLCVYTQQTPRDGGPGFLFPSKLSPLKKRFSPS